MLTCPLGWRSLRKLEQIVREELDAVGCQELMMPALHPVELWEKTGRHHAMGQILFSIVDRRERKLFLGPTHEEVITELARYQVRSYRDLPQLLYQIQTKFRDEPRPRGGLLRVREFDMMDLYSFDTDWEALDVSYQKVKQAYQRIYDRCGLPTMMVEADSGAIGGKDSHEFMAVTDTGEDQIIYCGACKYAANLEKAQSVKPEVPREAPLPLEEVSTPGMKSIEEVSGFLQGAEEPHPEGGLLLRRRPDRLRGHPGRPGGQRDQAEERPEVHRPAAGDRWRGGRRRAGGRVGVPAGALGHQDGGR